MKKILQLIFLVIGLTSCKAPEIDGIWMSYQNYVIDINSNYTSGNEGVIIDFDNQTISTIRTDSIFPLIIDFKHSKLFMDSEAQNIDFKVHEKDSIEIDFGGNMMHVFRPLKLTHKLSVDKSQLRDFLIKNDFEKINGAIDFDFSNKFCIHDEMAENPNKKNAFINKSLNDEGYWYIKEIKENYFLIFTLEQTSDKNIYQIISLDECNMQLEQLQEPIFGNAKITELKTCL